MPSWHFRRCPACRTVHTLQGGFKSSVAIVLGVMADSASAVPAVGTLELPVNSW